MRSGPLNDLADANLETLQLFLPIRGDSAMLGTKTGAGTEHSTERYEVIIFGAGVSGLVSASVLLNQGYRRILITDAYDHAGGNHIDWSANGYTFDVGSFIFQDDSP